ncbi:MAG: hypothetical protein K2I90_07250 [Odoribacter sp.]|nr:hypothetical protein [Odoribacter sp.]
MSKRIAIITGVIVILATLSVNVVFSDTSEDTNLSFSYIDAMAEGESSEIVQCIESGTICVGVDKNDLWGYHPGLDLNPDLCGK